jgi:hypothetical protein
MATKILSEGLIGRVAEPRPPKSPEGFEWPAPRGKRAATDADKWNFRSNLCDLMRERGMDVPDLAQKLYGREERNGHDQPRMAPSVRAWVTGAKFVGERGARFIASALGVPLARLLQPAEKFEPITKLLAGDPLKKRGAVNGAKNGHATNGNGHGGEIVTAKGKGKVIEVIPLPEGTPPPIANLELMSVDPRFARVKIEGVMATDNALTLIAMLSGRHG